MIIILDRKKIRWWTGDRLVHPLVCVLAHRGYSIAWTEDLKDARRWIAEEDVVEAVVVLGERLAIDVGQIPTIYPAADEPITSVLTALGEPHWGHLRVTKATNAA
jgi:hypothetical protein